MRASVLMTIDDWRMWSGSVATDEDTIEWCAVHSIKLLAEFGKFMKIGDYCVP